MENQENENLKSKFEKKFENQDSDFKNLLQQLCDEIDKFDTNILHTACILKYLPYEMAMLVIYNLKGFQDEYIGLLDNFYYDEFTTDLKKKHENGRNAFAERLNIQKNQNYEDFAVARLLTVGEIEMLIKIVIDQEKIQMPFENILKGEYKGGSQNIKKLVKAHQFLSHKKNAKINESIINKMSKFWLDLTLSEVIERKKERKEV